MALRRSRPASVPDQHNGLPCVRKGAPSSERPLLDPRRISSTTVENSPSNEATVAHGPQTAPATTRSRPTSPADELRRPCNRPIFAVGEVARDDSIATTRATMTVTTEAAISIAAGRGGGDAPDRRECDSRDVFTRDLDLPRGRERERARDRDCVYVIDGSEGRMLATVGSFRVVAEHDLAALRDDARKPHQSIRHLEDVGLIRRSPLDANDPALPLNVAPSLPRCLVFTLHVRYDRSGQDDTRVLRSRPAHLRPSTNIQGAAGHSDRPSVPNGTMQGFASIRQRN